ncbi:MAG TPA: ATP-dependent RNA helicase HrpA [Acidimicrobiales bacterium]|nr:ATP-dependent RNA helicase HrpA [Acidimicrobiales bacterium]
MRQAACRGPAILEDAMSKLDNRRARIEQRRLAVPAEIGYPENLPVTERRADILATIAGNQVVIVAGETGSGKSTQLPKLCLELGRGVQGLIGHTQPRRLAARSIAERVAEELGGAVGEVVGYTVRFTDRVSDRTLIKVMTDGILLAEIQRDPNLTRYDTLIIDEAHERSLNVDFLLGYLKQLLPRRPDLKVVITSATIDTERFSRHFDDAPVVEVSGRTYPVEVRFRPVVEDAEDTGRDQMDAICDAVQELSAEGSGDILVFLSGEREIRDTADTLAGLELRHTEILPLYARLTAADQHRVFQPHTGRRVVLATNVAETSLTVPGIRYVVDPGTARISRYNRRTKVQRLPIEPISQASANQRAGRCGRVAPGVCIRLYSEEDFASRPEFTDPEILRTNLASVILQMAAIGLGDVAAFPFVEPPDRRSIADGIALLEELDALHPSERGGPARLTPLGRRLAQLPLDPRLGRMVLEAERHDCLHEVMVIAAGLSIQDPRERPSEKQQAAAEKHARFNVEGSDFLAFVSLWDYVRQQQKALGSSQFRRLCKSEFLHFMRLREWQDVYSQLLNVVRSIGIHVNRERAPDDLIHQSLLAGLLSHVGMADEATREYRGARNARFVLSPGSSLAKLRPRWVMAAELVETNRLYAHTSARIAPEWAEKVGAHIVKRAYGEPRWDRKRGSAQADERVTLYGLPIVTARPVNYARIDPAHARELFIWHALVESDWDTHHAFMAENQRRVQELRDLEDRCRVRGLLVGEQTIFEFFDARVPDGVVSTRHFDRWWKRERESHPDLLTFRTEDLLDPDAGEVDVHGFPDTWRVGDRHLRLSYVYNPTAEDDGVTLHVPVPYLHRLPSGLDWQVPGLRHELVTSLLRSLPKDLRRGFAPASDHASEFLRNASPQDGPLLDVLPPVLGRLTGLTVPRRELHLDRLPDYLRVMWRVEDARGELIVAGRDLDEVRAYVRRTMRAAIARAGHPLERSGLTAWTFGELPRTVTVNWAGQDVEGYPALVDDGAGVSIRVLGSAGEQRSSMWMGTRRLLLLSVPFPRKHLGDRLTRRTKVALGHAPHAGPADLLDDCITAAVDQLLAGRGGPVWDERSWRDLRDHVRSHLGDEAFGVVALVGRILETTAIIHERAERVSAAHLLPAINDMTAQVSRLVYPGFVTETGASKLPDVLRYVRAVEHRLVKLPESPGRDLQQLREVQALEQELGLVRSRAEAERLRWLLEELRVSLFAQQLGTPVKVSAPRIRREIASAI